ncbi:proteasome subunit beta type-2-A-like [Forsythia ovata]|uniref:Proteasome subunit beta type-2-A-like n=1 Tax=Forsythia ovata TaxID=205694 RepID=A0ABD1UZL6_9LAMI
MADSYWIDLVRIYLRNNSMRSKSTDESVISRGGAGRSGSKQAQFTEYIQKNVALHQFQNGIPLTTAAAANITRGELATVLRKNPCMVNIILAGYDKETGPSLYFVDLLPPCTNLKRQHLVL